MIYVSEEQLKQVEYIIGQSTRGHHVLFDNDTVRKAFLQQDANQKTETVEQHIEKLMAAPTLLQKRAYIEKLSGNIRNQLVKLYFNLVENNIYENTEVTH